MSATEIRAFVRLSNELTKERRNGSMRGEGGSSKNFLRSDDSSPMICFKDPFNTGDGKFYGKRAKMEFSICVVFHYITWPCLIRSDERLTLETSALLTMVVFPL